MAYPREKFVLVSEAETTGRVREIFRQVKRALGMPYVSTMYQAYAAYPAFLELHWQAFKPVLETQEFFDLAGGLRAEAYTRMHNYFKIPDLCARMTDLSFTVGPRRELADAVELFHYSNSPLLLISAAQLQAFDRLVGTPRKSTHPDGHPVFGQRPLLVEEKTAPPGTRKIYEDMKRVLNLPAVNTDYCAFARWPDFFADYWSVLKNTAETPVYKESCSGIRNSSTALAQELPTQLNLTVTQLQNAGLHDDEITAAVRITESFLKMLSGLVLNVALAKIGMEGGTAAATPSKEALRESPLRAA